MNRRGNPQLAIILPTFRWNAVARDALRQAAATGSDDIVVHIGDNSTNPEKHDFLKGLAEKSTNVRVTCHAANLGTDGNWFYLFNAQTEPFYCMAADDDTFTPSYFRSGLNLIRDDPDCSVASGLHVSVAQGGTEDKRPILYTPDERLEADPLDRIQNYSNSNSICYGISRRASIADFVTYSERNPLGCPFNDYMLAFHLLSVGKYRLDRLGYIYAYDHGNWQDNDAFIKSNSRWYKGYNLPESFGYLTRLHWAVAAVHFFSSTFRSPGLSDDRADAIVAYLFGRQRTEFRSDYKRYKSQIDLLFMSHREAGAALSRLMNARYEDVTAIFDDFARVTAIFSKEVSILYRRFQSSTLRPQSHRLDLLRSQNTNAGGRFRVLTQDLVRQVFGARTR